MTNKIKSFAICLLVAIAMVMGAFALNTVGASGSFKMQNGASIRIRNTDNTYGIQFFANVDTSVEDATYNLMILPQTYVDFYEADKTQNKAPLAEWMLAKKAAHPEMPLAIVKNLVPDEDGVIKGSIVNVLYQNLNTKFVGAAYYEVEGTPVCADLATDDGRTVVEVAELAIADPENADFVTDLQGIVKDGIHQANGKEQGTVEALAIALNKTTANMYIGEQLELSYTPAIATSLANWSVEGDAVTVENGKVTAVKAGTATVSVSVVGATASCVVTVSNVQVINAENVTVNAESATKGSVTFTSPEGAYLNSSKASGSIVAIKGDFDDEFIKVGFKTPTDLSKPETFVGDWSSYLGDTLGVGGHVSEAALSNFTGEGKDNSPLNFHVNVAPSAYGGGMKLNANGANFYNYWYASVLKNGYYDIQANTDYYYVYGLLTDAEGVWRVYFALLDSEENVIWSGYMTQAQVVDNVTEPFAKTAFGTKASLSGSFIITSSLAEQSRTVTYEVVSKSDALAKIASNVVASTLSQANGSLSWTEVKWADGYKYKVDDGEWTDTTETSVELGIGSYTVQVKAYNAEIESNVATIDYLYIGKDILVKNATNIEFTELDYDKGSVSYTNGSAAGSSIRTNATTLLLQKQYADELVKIKFTPKGASWTDQKISIGLRQTVNPSNNDYLNEWNLQPQADHGIWASRYDYPQQVYPMSAGFGGTNIVGGSLSWTNMFDTKMSHYYALAGVVGTGEDAAIYFGIQDKDGKLLKLTALPWSAIVARHGGTYSTEPLAQFADTGWFAIYEYGNLGGAGSITYEVVTLAEIGMLNYATGSADTKNGVTTYTLTANSTAVKGNASYFTDLTKYTDKFAKVGFTGVSGNFTAQNLGFGIRSSLQASVTGGNGYVINQSQYGQGAVLSYGGTNKHVSPTGYGRVIYGNWSNSYTDNTQYYAYFGAIGTYAAATDTTEATDVNYYFAISEVVEGVEVLKFVVRWSYIENGFTTASAESGYLVVWNYATTEKTFTYEIVDNSTILDQITA